MDVIKRVHGSKDSLLKRFISYCRRKSPWILHYNSGGCNGCVLEILSAISPRNDLERFGILLKGSPRHADILLVDGPITIKTKRRLINIYKQMTEPKFVMAIGSCALSKGIYYDCYNVCGPLDKIIPVDVWVPGCPPRPEAIIYGMLKILEKI